MPMDADNLLAEISRIDAASKSKRDINQPGSNMPSSNESNDMTLKEMVDKENQKYAKQQVKKGETVRSQAQVKPG
eukprot:CAMPEP_0185597800 /NCGR_PEP_ID=MMETSP0434-20130131/81593_1 /TAXON_ID=626734 ORGANISM="Favella taraikaensis, Strain Fe Narragansett Bay" /NCGR_SAMPLE_ID=MMETSP0434 /ASSEMBLY_ACC=CAM_ASM_000379 /LENGTH=74 /DNA_ID=CAMNT_0028226615 /DNA_START=2092 /DNA_END=2316 /DNA_ORIENTATION=-